MINRIIIGSRGSKLSIAYTEKAKNLIVNSDQKLKSKILYKKIKTTGDRLNEKKISEIGGKNLFCKEIEESLLADKIDIAIHSLKDMESIENSELIIGAYIKRNDCRDVIISDKIKNISDLKKGAIIGSSSRRRELQLKKISEKISIINIRGNIDTRIKKLEENKLDGVILAAAGIKSLNLNSKVGFIFGTTEILPAAGQGVIAVQCRKNNTLIQNFLKKINHLETSLCSIAERKMLETIGGDCETAIGALAEIENSKLKLKAQLFSDVGNECFEYELTGKDLEASNIGKSVGEKLLQLAGRSFKKK